MARKPLLCFALLATLAATTANAEGFKATIGYENANPKSSTGTFGGASSDVNDKWGATGSLAYNFDDNWSAEVWTGLTPFKHDVDVTGAGTVASFKQRPTALTANYHFLPKGKFNPYVGIGYDWVSVSGEKATGALAGNQIKMGNGSGLTYTVGADVAINDSFFVRGSVRKLNASSDVAVNGIAAGKANLDPLVYGVSAGF